MRCMRGVCCRGVATFNDGLPMREGSVRMLWGAGVRAGLYPLSDTEVYWFTTANAPEVGLTAFLDPETHSSLGQ